MSEAHLEAHLEAMFRKSIRLVGGQCVKLAPTERGIPDRLVLMPNGRMYLVELKTETGRVSPIQAAWHEKVALLGHTVQVVYGAEGVRRWVRAALSADDPQSKPGPKPRVAVR